jgi:hypothetical protein
LIISLITVLMPCVALGQSIATYDFTGQPGNQASNPSSGVAPGLTASVLDRGPGVTASAATGSISSSAWSTGALDLTDYYQFTLTPDPGATLNVDQIIFSERRSATGIRDIVVRSSLDSFTADLFNVNVPDETLTRQQTVNLGVAFDSLTSDVTFRIYGFTAEAAGGTWRLGVAGGADNPNSLPSTLVVNGSVSAVPEPASWVLIGLSVAGVGVYSRRIKRNLLLRKT